ncbi:MAG: hypothetical protein V4685_00790 [Bacteroidota bacterium]
MKKPLLVFISFFIFSALSAQVTGISVNLFTYLDNNERALEDGVGILFNGQSDSVDLSDARKLTNPLENIAILRNNILLGIEQRTTFDTIPLTTWNLKQRDYELEIFTMNISVVYFEDIIANTRQQIATGDTLRYRFTNTTDNSPKDSSVRYRLVFATAPPPPNNNCGGHHPPRHRRNEERRIKLYPNPVPGNYINIEMKDLSAGRCRITFLGALHTASYDFMHGNNSNERIDVTSFPKGKYYVMIEDEEGWKETRQIEVL